MAKAQSDLFVERTFLPKIAKNADESSRKKQKGWRKMKQPLFLNMAERGVVLTAMKSYLRSTDGPYKPLFELTLKKVQGASFPSLDGMEMIVLVKALRWRSQLFMTAKQYAEQNLYLDLSDRIDEIRQDFQYHNAPEIIKSARAVCCI